MILYSMYIDSVSIDYQGVLEFPKPYDRMLTLVAGQKWKDIRNTLSPTFSASKMKHVSKFIKIYLYTSYIKNYLFQMV